MGPNWAFREWDNILALIGMSAIVDPSLSLVFRTYCFYNITGSVVSGQRRLVPSVVKQSCTSKTAGRFWSMHYGYCAPCSGRLLAGNGGLVSKFYTMYEVLAGSRTLDGATPHHARSRLGHQTDMHILHFRFRPHANHSRTE
jgi:hypothetical protein